MATVAAMMATAGCASSVVFSRSSCLFVSDPSLRSSKRIVRLRCSAEPDPESETVTPPSLDPSGPLDNMTPTPSVMKSKVTTSTNFGDIFAFTGPAPEAINGRLAMLGFIAAIGVELGTGESLVTQLQNGGVRPFLFAVFLLTTASLVPLFKGVSAESKSKRFFSSDAEKWNGRAAMIGLVALAITEFVNGRPLV